MVSEVVTKSYGLISSKKANLRALKPRLERLESSQTLDDSACVLQQFLHFQVRKYCFLQCEIEFSASQSAFGCVKCAPLPHETLGFLNKCCSQRLSRQLELNVELELEGDLVLGVEMELALALEKFMELDMNRTT